MVDFTRRNVQRQLKAMGVDRVEVGVLAPGQDKADNKMSLRTWTIDQALKSLGWLKGQNAMGCHIFIRPLGSQGLIFIDDLTLAGLTKLEEDGLHPACVIESSPMNYHAWIRVSNEPIDTALGSAIGVALAIRYEGDPNSSDWRHFGRLVGFTNRKPKYVKEDGSYPYVMLRQSTTKAASFVDSEPIKRLVFDGECLLAERQKSEAIRLEKLRVARLQSVPIGDLPDPERFYRTQLHGLVGRYGDNLNLSTADWMIGKRMAEAGYLHQQVMLAILKSSPDLATRHSGHVEDYLTRTVNKLFGIANETA